MERENVLARFDLLQETKSQHEALDGKIRQRRAFDSEYAGVCLHFDAERKS